MIYFCLEYYLGWSHWVILLKQELGFKFASRIASTLWSYIKGDIALDGDKEMPEIVGIGIAGYSGNGVIL
jgi:hypothetical protein